MSNNYNYNYNDALPKLDETCCNELYYLYNILVPEDVNPILGREIYKNELEKEMSIEYNSSNNSVIIIWRGYTVTREQNTERSAVRNAMVFILRRLVDKDLNVKWPIPERFKYANASNTLFIAKTYESYIALKKN